MIEKIFKLGLVISFILYFNAPVYSGEKEFSVQVDTSRFTLKFSNYTFSLIDNLKKDSVIIKYDFPINPDEELEDEQPYVSSFNFIGKTNSFEIGIGLIGIHLFSYDFMKEGSAQAAAGRDLFFVYDPLKNNVSENVLDFGITKQRQKYMGCLSAKTSHFILADIDKNGSIDIGRIEEELRCDESFKTFFVQDSVDWHVFNDSSWTSSTLKTLPAKYVDLPLIDIKLNPIDVFGFNKWQSFDPKEWDGKSAVHYYPAYRLELIKAGN